MANNMGKTTWKNHTPIYNTRIYRIWGNMIQRCDNPNNTHYKYYGGIGINVCDEWRNSKDFIKWAMENGYEENLTLDRIDGTKGYYPDNCRWVTRKEQSNNVKNNRIITIKGVSHNISEWANISGIALNTLYKRANSGWDSNRLLDPVDRRFSHVR